VKKDFAYYWDIYGTLMILALMFLITSLFAPPQFLSGENFTQILTQSATVLLIAVGEFFAILIAGIDLSVGSVIALTGMSTALLMDGGMHPVLAFTLGSVGVGALCGLFNGGLTVLTKLHPFIITIGSMSIFRGVALIISDASPVFGITPGFKNFFGGKIFGVSMPIVISLVFAGILYFVARQTKFGRNLYAMGGNRESAWYSGINVSLHTIVAFIISGIAAGLSGAVMTARLGSAEPMAGDGYELFAIAAAIIGGTSFFGGKGKVPNVVVGALVIGLINNALNMLGVDSYFQQVATGTLIILAVTLDMFISKKKAY